MQRHWFFLFMLTAWPGILQAQDTTQKAVPGRRNSPAQQDKPYVILISADGFRYDYATKHGATHLQALARQGVQATYMMPSYPTLTFPNHYTIVTGLYPSHHGLVDNQFYAKASGEIYTMSNQERVRHGKWYGGVPLWVLAEQQQLLSASFYWVGTEAPIGGLLPSYYYHYSTRIPIQQRIQQVVKWLTLPPDVRPHFISFYFPEVDHEGHTYGPDAPQTKEAVQFVDNAVHELTKAVRQTGLDVNFIFVADHGMTQVDTLRPLTLPTIDTSMAVMVPGGELAQVYVRDSANILPLYRQLQQAANGFSVMLKDSMPARLHYARSDDAHNRIGDILLMADSARTFVAPGRKPKAGAHGFDPAKVPDMRTIFYAWGPAFKKGKTVPPFENVEVYPIVARLLGLQYSHRIDGTGKVADDVLK